jgi:hypothetical protein
MQSAVDNYTAFVVVFLLFYLFVYREGRSPKRYALVNASEWSLLFNLGFSAFSASFSVLLTCFNLTLGLFATVQKPV